MRFMLFIILLCIWGCIGVAAAWDINQENRIKYLESNQCNCTVNINGSIMSVEDGFYYLLEGLSEDQADEVRIMINSSVEKEWARND